MAATIIGTLESFKGRKLGQEIRLAITTGDTGPGW